ncbi:hypothetical protein [Thiobacillus denitrificans]|uniref:hypothetical protein n=1 Tax=Thiobacillus denitrificans TaxID=36861 RepID=UPI003AF40269
MAIACGLVSSCSTATLFAAQVLQGDAPFRHDLLDVSYPLRNLASTRLFRLTSQVFDLFLKFLVAAHFIFLRKVLT